MTVVKALGAIHDHISRASFAVAAIVLTIMTSAYCFEVVSRYFFNKPTVWASPLVSYGLCASIFLAMPDLTRRSAHVAVDLYEQLISPEVGRVLLRLMQLVSGLACFFAAWITGTQTWSEYVFEVWTNTYWPIPKWWLFILIPYGMISSGLYFIRQACGEEIAVDARGVQT
jgi:TRAP-type C4-dicarboxylate transport system permease small subunit